MEFYSALNKNEIMLFAGKWMEMEIFMLDLVSKTQHIKGQVCSLICGS
jgi:hypothetical protein